MRNRPSISILTVVLCIASALAAVPTLAAVVSFDSTNTMTLTPGDGITNMLHVYAAYDTGWPFGVVSSSTNTQASGYYSLELVGSVDSSAGTVSLTGLRFVKQSGVGQIVVADCSLSLALGIESATIHNVRTDFDTPTAPVSVSAGTYPLTSTLFWVNNGTINATGVVPYSEDFGANPASDYLVGNGTISVSAATINGNLGTFSATAILPANYTEVDPSSGGTVSVSNNVRSVGTFQSRLPATYTWVAGSSSWVTPGNWSVGGAGNPGNFAPASSDSVLLSNGGTISLDGTQSVLNIGATGAGGGIVGTIQNGNLAFQYLYIKSGTINANLSNIGSSSRLWIGGDATATVYLGGVNTSTYSDSHSTIIGYGSVTGAAGTVTLLSGSALGPSSQQAQVFTGTLDLNGQTNLSIGSIVLESGASSFFVNNNTSATASYAGVLDFSGTSATYVGGPGNMVLSAVLQNGGFVKTGNGAVTLSGVNTFTGSTTVSAGMLAFGANNVIPGGPVTVNGGTLFLGAYSGTVGAVTLQSGAITGAGGALTSTGGFTVQGGTAGAVLAGSVGLTKTTTGAVVLGGANTYSGDTTVALGTLKLGAANVIPDGSGKGNVSLVGLLDMGGYSDTINGLSGSGAVDNTVSGAPTLTVGGNNVTSSFSGAIQNSAGTLSLTKIGTGTLTLNAANTYAGTTTVSAGVLAYGANNVIGAGAVTVAGGTLSLGSYSDSVGAVTLQSGAITGAGGALTGTSGFTVQGGTASAVLAGSVGLTKSTTGTVVLGGANTYSGDTTVALGTLKLGAANVLPDGSGKGNVSVAGLLDMGDYSDTINGLSGSGAVNNTVSGAPTLTVGGNNVTSTFSGVIRNTAGTLSLTKIGAGTLVLSGANAYTGRTVVQAGIVELAAAARNPVLTLSPGGADVQGGKMVFDYSGNPPNVGALVTASYNGGQWNGGRFFCTTENATHGLGWVDNGLTAVTVMYTLYGDANLDGSVNGTDLNTVLSSYNATGAIWGQGDFNYDGTVNGADLNIVLSNYNQHVSVGAAVPEPSTVILLAVGAIGLSGCAGRRRKHRA